MVVIVVPVAILSFEFIRCGLHCMCNTADLVSTGRFLLLCNIASA
jgi:hypothetical protein